MRTTIVHQLNEYLSTELVSNKYMQKHNYKRVNAAKIKAITLHVEQGLEFFRSATNASITTRPLLQYYGVSSLSKAVCMFLDNRVTEAQLEPSHGLSAFNWRQTLSASTQHNIKDLEIKVTGGLFSQLCEATGQKDLLRANSNRPNMHIVYDVPKMGTLLNFAGLIKLIPDLWHSSKHWVGQNSSIYDLREVKGLENGTIEVKIYPAATDEQLDKIFSVKPTSNIHDQVSLMSTVTLDENVSVQLVQRYSYNFGTEIGDVSIVPPLKEGVYLSRASTIYAISYILSMLARYHLTDWLQIWQGGRNDSARPTLQIFMDNLEDSYTQTCTELMDGYGR